MNHCKRIKIMFVLNNLVCGGAERVVTCLLNSLDKDKYELHLVVQFLEGSLAEDVSPEIPIHVLNRRTCIAAPALARLIRHIKPRIVFSCGVGPTVAVSIAKLLVRDRDIKYIARETSIPQCRKKAMGWMSGFDWFYKMAFRRFDRVICQSEDMAKAVTDAYSIGSRRIIRIANPVDICNIRNLALDDASICPADDEIVLVAIGSLRYPKGFDLLVKAAALMKSNSMIRIYILGEGVDRDKLENLACELGVADKVMFCGFIKNPYACLHIADGFVLSSRYEGFPNVLLEAMALGVPPIAFDCPGDIKRIIRNKSIGVLVEAENVKQLARAMDARDYLRLDRKQIGKSIIDRYSKGKIVEEYQKLFDALAVYR